MCMGKTTFDRNRILPADGKRLSWDISLLGKREAQVASAGDRIKNRLEFLLSDTDIGIEIQTGEFSDKYSYSIKFEAGISQYEVKDVVSATAARYGLGTYMKSKFVEENESHF